MKMPSLDHPVTSAWLEVNGRRLDSRPYVSGAVEARVLLQKLAAEKVPLKTVTQAIFNGPRFARTYVDDPAYGVPFMGSTDILAADLSTLPYLSKKQVQANPELLIEEGWTLISCSGTIGRMAYARTDMRGMAGSQHFMRVVPNPDKILPGYLYAYLSSRFGVSQVVEGTYGAIIQHIEPHHIAGLSVPRLGEEIEQATHNLIAQAARLRTDARQNLQEAARKINEHFGFPEKIMLKPRNFSTTVVSSSTIRSRLDATYHDAAIQGINRLLDIISRTMPLRDLRISVGETGRLKQLFVEPEYGVPYLTSSEIFRLCYEPDRYISRRLVTGNDDWAIQEGDLLLARSGQVGGIIGRGVWADRRFKGACVSMHVLRLRVTDQRIILPGYLFAYLFLTDVGYRQLVRFAAGSSIPFLSAAEIMSVRVPRTASDIEQDVHTLVQEAGELRAMAQENEDQARRVVEEAIQEGAGVGRDRSDGAAG